LFPTSAFDIFFGISGGDGSPGGYRWGLPWKEKILRREAACDNAE